MYKDTSSVHICLPYDMPPFAHPSAMITEQRHTCTVEELAMSSHATDSDQIHLSFESPATEVPLFDESFSCGVSSAIACQNAAEMELSNVPNSAGSNYDIDLVSLRQIYHLEEPKYEELQLQRRERTRASMRVSL